MLLTAVGALCITPGVRFPNTAWLSVGFVLLASFVFINFTLDDVASFGNLVLYTGVFRGACLPGFVELISCQQCPRAIV